MHNATCTYEGPDPQGYDVVCGAPARRMVLVRANGEYPPGAVCDEHFDELLACGDYVPINPEHLGVVQRWRDEGIGEDTILATLALVSQGRATIDPETGVVRTTGDGEA